MGRALIRSVAVGGFFATVAALFELLLLMCNSIVIGSKFINGDALTMPSWALIAIPVGVFLAFFFLVMARENGVEIVDED